MMDWTPTPAASVLAYTDSCTNAAILGGPSFAVGLTRWLDEYRVKRARRWDTFRDLMRYRSDPINLHFVGALNLLEVEFADDKRVTGAWALSEGNWLESARCAL